MLILENFTDLSNFLQFIYAYNSVSQKTYEVVGKK